MTPLIIVGMPRTGSTLLHTGVTQHPQTRVYGELFHPVRQERVGSHAIIRNGERIFFNETTDDAIAFLDKHVFLESEQIDVIGFKVFRELVSCQGTTDFFERLKAHYANLHVLHIVRSNYLDVLISREVARATNDWVRFVNSPPKQNELTKVRIEPDQALTFFNEVRSADTYFGSIFDGERYLKVDYDELSASFSQTMQKVYEFLGVRPFEPEIKVKKQIDRGAAEIVENYEELADYFVSTEFGSFFQRS
ncbi:LPS sulfotransferase NodH [Rhodoblastus acidophilus]|uniref:sulfotransferase family protein n=1 Tax=Rhodoblastus acidophilus TaxID=1074 RepID=UPI0018B01C31|nr:sulfotransferase [Rhodoblastus acidophilus]MCW2274661.1 LPS sulfotransferase NodH [Rhodoblastus acidophilus]